MKLFFTQGFAQGPKLILLLAVSVGLMFLDQRKLYTQQLRAGLSVLVLPLQYVVDGPAEVGQQLARFFSTRKTLLRDNAALKQEHFILKAKMQKLIALERENTRLRALLKSSPRAGERVLVGELLKVDTDPYSHRVVLNKGSEDGVYVGQPLLDANGVIGQIVHVSALTSVALLVTDNSHATPVQDNRSGARAIAVGTSDYGRLKLAHVTNTADIKVGDLLVTSGLGGRFPVGYPVGIVAKIERDPGRPFARVIVHPSAHLNRVREVLLVWRGKQKVKPATAKAS